MASTDLRFYFDYISHNAYIAWTQIAGLAARHRRRVEPVPVLFAGLLDATGQLGPAEVPAKARWMIGNLLRKTAELGLPFRPPASHPFSPLLPLRVSSLPMPHATRLRLVDALFRATWAEGVDITDAKSVAAIASAAGLDGDAAIRAAGTPEAKAQLRRQTDDAIAAGVFGVPTILVDGELFFGYDDHPWLEKFLRGEDPLDRDALEAFGRVRATARRVRRTTWGLRFDPVHGDTRPAEALRRLFFLLGHFRGEGHYAEHPGSFHKEMIGSLEASGRFLSLRMAVAYPLDDGREDVHEALVIVGADQKGALSARSYTDGGRIHEFALEASASGIRFDDVPPAHGPRAQRARKSLEPTSEGITERVELDLGDGGFVPYSTLTLHRVARGRS